MTSNENLFLKRVKEALRNPHAFAFKLALQRGWKPLLHLTVANPATFNQKVRYRMVHDRREILGVFADKLTSKRYVIEKLGLDHVPRLLAWGTRCDELDRDALPREYALKVSHASGGIILVTESADTTATLPEPGLPFSRHVVHPDTVSFEEMVPVIDAWLRRPYPAKFGEWAYGQRTPSVLVEEYLRSPTGGPPPDLKFFVFDGRTGMMRLDTPTRAGKSLNHYRSDGTPLSARFGEYHTGLFEEIWPPPDLPTGWREAQSIAERLGEGIDFVRVDTFQLGSRTLVGELTNYPTNGTGRYIPRSLDRWLGDHWKLSVETD